VSDFTKGAMLCQKDEDGQLHPIAFHSRKVKAAEIKYDVHDKELLAVESSFKGWHRYLEVGLKTVMVYSDQQYLEYFRTTKVLNQKHSC
jgi:hypothetical protein